MSPGALRRAEDGTQVMRVGDLVAHHQQGRFALFRSSGEHGLHAHILPDGGQGDDALMGVGAGHIVQFPPIRLHHHDACLPGPGGDVAQGLVRLPLGQVDFVDGGVGAQRLNDGIAALDDAVGLRLRLRSRFPVFVFSHGPSPLVNS